jgi:hypothetical protein
MAGGRLRITAAGHVTEPDLTVFFRRGNGVAGKMKFVLDTRV